MLGRIGLDDADVLLEVLGWLEPREIGHAAAISRAYNKADRTPLLWFHVYSRLFRDHLTAPPRFDAIRRGAATALVLAAFDWRELTIRRAVIDADQLYLATMLDVRTAPADRRGMLDVRNTSRYIATASLEKPLVSLPLARPLAYAEAWVLGGASVGIMSGSGNRMPPHAHIGWTVGCIGWHGDDGRMYRHERYPGTPFGPTFGFDPARVHRNAGPEVPRQPDVVGVGIERGADGYEQAFFTKNGALVGTVPLPGRYRLGFAQRFFAFALDSRGDYASVNGGSSRFLFDLEAYSQQPPHPLTLRVLEYPDSDSDSDSESDSDSDA